MISPPLMLLAAGSLKSAFQPLVAQFQQHTGLAVDVQFGPAGLLRERIESGTPCAVFASANAAHPQALLQAGLAQECRGLARNQLMLTVRRSPENDALDWLALLSAPRLRLATSTPGCDPSGDYTWQLFTRLEARYPGLGKALSGRAQPLVGGRDSLSVPPGAIAGAWLIRQNLADLFIGYAHYGAALAACDDLRTLVIPAPWNICCDYQLARLSADPAATALYRFILGEAGQACLRRAGFLSFSDAG
ncbi:substrate-binding domain-containing protein [Klebsiella quasipneumoniae]|uniref:Molybdate ABC transporter substrate-binding protein n=1 Tax=Klebsiella quasipneumoniae TaxID=1463165 RepID=A0AAI8J152_9ENTR|nr:extracellular solute-binding protein [Klebsiella quasipneumoniae]HBS0591888.1 substrate-binding domain-containing protein [Klebsiella quasipneumoniae subsp. quasipneumoniae]AWL60187.1 molybdate ABC transporter substrate-binding protein [Klebsiella quasipneumoniae]AWL65969.1 molybdate ABC transporter substrate-binding protein [Klebsiella quasipneumoniae]AWL77440.1 molybdate ABC transporter substrate-binding protein [Klebsiella quasipneumoniae]EKZ5324453.1 substrate-binding domain-containing 